MRKIIMLVTLTLLVGLMTVGVASSALAGGKQFDVFDMNDRFASEMGAHGNAKVRLTQDGSIEVARVQAAGLRPNHSYELIVTIGPPGEFGPTQVRTSASLMSNPGGQVLFRDVDLGPISSGDYRVDLFVAHTHPTEDGQGETGKALTALFKRDPLLACQPAPVVTVE